MKILVGVSGGPDSLCLLDILSRLGYSLVVAHLNHLLRLEAKSDALVVRKNTEERGHIFVYAEANVKSIADEGGYSVEEAGRILRYRFLFEQADKFGAQAVAVGHTADDQVETVLMHLLRGSGLAGLKGMEYRSLPNPWSAAIPLLRPLLATTHAQILEYAQEFNLSPVIDETNFNSTYYRNRLRNELIPYLHSFQPNVSQTFWRMAQVLAGDMAILEEVIKNRWELCIKQQGQYYVGFDLDLFLLQPIGVQRHLIRHALNIMRPGLRDINFASIERVVTGLIKSDRVQQIEITGNVKLWQEGQVFWIASKEADLPRSDWPQLPVEDRLGETKVLNLPGIVQLENGWHICAEPFDVNTARERSCINADPNQEWISLDEVETPLVVRTRLHGERFQPFGLGGHSLRLSEFMINMKIPNRARAGWPLVCTHAKKPLFMQNDMQLLRNVAEEQVVWLPGYRLGYAFRLTESTQRAAWLQLIKNNDKKY